MATQAERRAATRRSVVEAAREQFATDGYEQTTTEHIRERAGVSRGAMYHHFASKRDVFEAVVAEVTRETIERALRRSRTHDSPLRELTDACMAWLHEVARADVAAILLEQAPYVLGWERARELEDTASLGLMVAALERAAAAGEIAVVSVPITARLLGAVLAEAALVARNATTAGSTRELEASVRQFIDGLRAGSPGR